MAGSDRCFNRMFSVWYIGWCFLFLKQSKKQKMERESLVEFNDGLLCRFVLDGQGKKIGESIALFDDLLIIKSEKDFLGIPMKHIQAEGSHLIVKGLLDQSKALELGAKWQKATYKEIIYL